jgi:pyruvate ferredoxin oxidoreductase alpha subunit
MALSGGELVAHAMRQVNPDVVAAYPITPQTVITETFSEFVANGLVQTEFVPVESEHAAMSACIGAAAAGGRAQTATSGPGLALMWEVLWVASGNRLPIVMHLCTRSLSAPINILCDHADAMGMRDAGWIMLFAEGAQEAYDNGIMAVRIAEHPEVLLPVASILDGFLVTHSVEKAEILPDEAVAEFVGIYKARHSLLKPGEEVTFGPLDFHDFYFEHKRQQLEAMERAKEVIKQVSEEFAELTGRSYGLIEPYRMEDAQVAAIVMGSAAGTVRTVVDELRREGIRAGAIRIRSFRPFPVEELVASLGRVKAVAILERSISFGGADHPLAMEIKTLLYTHGLHPLVRTYIYGLGGRDTPPYLFREALEELLRPPEDQAALKPVRYLGIRD